MNYVKLGRTGLQVSKAGLGGGGHSRLGLRMNLGDENAVKIINTALDLGVNFFDTSAAYGTEYVLGKGLQGSKRQDYVLSTKFPPRDYNRKIKSEGSLTKSLEQSLINLQTDYIDIFHLHAVYPDVYVEIRDRFLPELIKAKESGKIGWFGITEMFGKDTHHVMLRHALKDDLWDVIMVGLNIINSSASKTILPLTKENDIGTLLMFAVRTALSNEERLKEIISELDKSGEIDISPLNKEAPLDFLTKNNVATSIIDAAYRFCANTEGIDVVLSGTSSLEHLNSNIQSIMSHPLPEETINKIYELFGNVTSVSGE